MEAWYKVMNTNFEMLHFMEEMRQDFVDLCYAVLGYITTIGPFAHLV